MTMTMTMTTTTTTTTKRSNRVRRSSARYLGASALARGSAGSP
jgi:hypothetical protein